MSPKNLLTGIGVFVLAIVFLHRSAASPESSFRDGVEAYRAGKYADAAKSFRTSLDERTAPGTLLNLGMAEWRRGGLGQAVLAWEQAAWMNPLDPKARHNLEFVRTSAQMDPPELTWYERSSTWLPANAWTWLAGANLALALGMVVIPGVLRARKAGWQQALAAAGLCGGLLCVAPCAGIVTRANLAIVLERNTPLLLTPTRDGETVSTLPAGQSVRKVRSRGEYVLVRTLNGSGWVKRERIGFICPAL